MANRTVVASVLAILGLLLVGCATAPPPPVDDGMMGGDIGGDTGGMMGDTVSSLTPEDQAELDAIEQELDDLDEGLGEGIDTELDELEAGLDLGA